MKTRAELQEWLKTDAASDIAEAARAARAFVARTNNGGPTHDFASSILQDHWLPLHPDADMGDIRSAVTDAKEWLERVAAAEEAARARDRKDSERARASERQRRQAQEERLRMEREARAESVKKIAEAFQCTTRYAQMILRDGVKDRQRARELATLLGGSEAVYFRRKAKPGRAPDLVGAIMRLRPEGVSFHDFIHDATELQGAVAEAAAALYAVADECNRLEPMLAHASERGVDPETARLLWLHFKKWRVTVIADRAAEQAAEELERFFEFA